MDDGCPCGSGLGYVACCGALHHGTSVAPTALDLMRSRYCAFVIGDADYLLSTWHPSTRPPVVEIDPAVEWRRLQIRATTGGGEDDHAGTVEFVAHYWHSGRGQYGRHHENSRFARVERRWFYVEPVP